MSKATTTQILDLLKAKERLDRSSKFHIGVGLANFLHTFHQNVRKDGFSLEGNIEIISVLLAHMTATYYFASFFPDIYVDDLSESKAEEFKAKGHRILLGFLLVNVMNLSSIFSYCYENSSSEKYHLALNFLLYLSPILLQELKRVCNGLILLERQGSLKDQLNKLFNSDQEEFPIADLFKLSETKTYLTIDYSDNKSKRDPLIEKYKQLPGNFIMNLLAVFLAERLETGSIIYEKNQITIRLRNHRVPHIIIKPEEFIQQLKNMLICHKFLVVLAKVLNTDKTITLKETSLHLPISKGFRHLKLLDHITEILDVDSEDKVMIVDFANETTLANINAHFERPSQQIIKTKTLHNSASTADIQLSYITNNLFIDIEDKKNKKAKVKTRKPGASLSSFWSAAPSAPQAPEIYDFGEHGIYNSSNKNTDDPRVIRKIETKGTGIKKYSAIFVRAKDESIPVEIFESMHIAHHRMGTNGLIFTLDNPEEAYESMPIFAKFKNGKNKEYIATLAYKLEISSGTYVPLIIFNHSLKHNNQATQWSGKKPTIPVLNMKEEESIASNSMSISNS